MAIKPSSDIVLEVLKAADPVRAQAAAQRLSALGAAAGVGAADDFANVLDATDPSSAGAPAAVANPGNMRDRLSELDLDAADDQKAARTQIEFEASILKTFVDAILPKDENDVYGQGTAGDVWKSMLADQIAKQIAKSGAFGISKRLFATHPLPGHDHAAGGSLTIANSLADIAVRGAADAANAATPMFNDAGFKRGAFLSPASNRS
jgi:flagellar protein FlgJ